MSISNAYEGTGVITVDDRLKDPTYLPERILENLDGTDLVPAIFRDGGPNNGVVVFTEAESPYFEDDPEIVAEYAEIPTTDGEGAQKHAALGVKTALGFDISWETRHFNQIDPLNKGITKLQNTFVRANARSVLAAFFNAEVPELAVATDWEANDADPMRDIRQAKRMVSNASLDGNPDARYGYKPDILLTNEATVDAALFHESVQRFYRGDVASENPIYKGITPQMLGGLRVVTSTWIPEGEAYVLQGGTVGFYSDAQALTVSPVYAPEGENGYGGRRQYWRVDAFQHRAIAVDNPKACVKLVGIEA